MSSDSIRNRIEGEPGLSQGRAFDLDRELHRLIARDVHAVDAGSEEAALDLAHNTPQVLAIVRAGHQQIGDALVQRGFGDDGRVGGRGVATHRVEPIPDLIQRGVEIRPLVELEGDGDRTLPRGGCDAAETVESAELFVGGNGDPARYVFGSRSAPGHVDSHAGGLDVGKELAVELVQG